MWNTPLYSTTKVTIELRDIIREGVNVWGDDSPCLLHPDFINHSKCGLQEDEVKKTVLEHFMFRQIGFETVGRFLTEWRQKTREISPRYLNITYSQSLLLSQDDPLESYHLTETFNETNEGTSTGTSTGSGSSTSTSDVTTSDSESGTKTASGSVSEDKTHLFSDTPQGTIANIDTHLTNATVDDNTSSTSDNETTSREGNESSTSESTSSDTSSATSEASAESTITRTLERFGNIGVQPLGDEVRKFQEAFDDIIAMLIKEYEPLFLRVY